MRHESYSTVSNVWRAAGKVSLGNNFHWCEHAPHGLAFSQPIPLVHRASGKGWENATTMASAQHGIGRSGHWERFVFFFF